MAAFKVVQKIASVTGSNSVNIALKTGYPFFLELACNLRARQVIKKRRMGKN